MATLADLQGLMSGSSETGIPAVTKTTGVEVLRRSLAGGEPAYAASAPTSTTTSSGIAAGSVAATSGSTTLQTKPTVPTTGTTGYVPPPRLATTQTITPSVTNYSHTDDSIPGTATQVQTPGTLATTQVTDPSNGGLTTSPGEDTKLFYDAFFSSGGYNKTDIYDDDVRRFAAGTDGSIEALTNRYHQIQDELIKGGSPSVAEVYRLNKLLSAAIQAYNPNSMQGVVPGGYALGAGPNQTWMTQGFDFATGSFGSPEALSADQAAKFPDGIPEYKREPVDYGNPVANSLDITNRQAEAKQTGDASGGVTVTEDGATIPTPYPNTKDVSAWEFVALNKGNPTLVAYYFQQKGWDINKIADMLGFQPTDVESYFQANGVNYKQPVIDPYRGGGITPGAGGSYPYSGTIGTIGIGNQAVNPAVPRLTTAQLQSQATQNVAQGLINPEVPERAYQVYTPLLVQNGEFQTVAGVVTPETGGLASITAKIPTIVNPDTGQVEYTEVSGPMALAANTYTATLTKDLGTVPSVIAAIGANPSEIQAALIDPASAPRMSAAVAALPQEALVSVQLETLLDSLNSGIVPNWAKPAVDQANAMLAARGVGRSTVAQQALYNSIITSALPIAQQNAVSLKEQAFKNLDNEQQARALNLEASMKVVLSNQQVQQSATNATAELISRMQLANLTNEQQASVMNAQIRQQFLVTDAAAANAASQFNAQSQNQTDQFMANLKAQIDTNNASRNDTMKQYLTTLNQQVSFENAKNMTQAAIQEETLNAQLRQFRENLGVQAQQFNIQNAEAIEQSNVQWRRQVNTANTAGENAANQANAINAFNLYNQSLSFVWQEMRDAANFAYTSATNYADQQTRLAMAALGNEATLDASKIDSIKNIAGFAFNLLNDSTK